MICDLQKKLLSRERANNIRVLPGEPKEYYIDFSSNDYLGLSRSQQLFELWQEEILNQNPHKNGSTGSRLLTGNSIYAETLETFLAQFHGYESGVLFGCGYMANIGITSALSSHDNIFLFDSQSHTSTKEGIRSSKTMSLPFRHNDLEHLESRLCAFKNKSPYIYVESVYSTDGSTAPLEDLCNLADCYNAQLIVDESHAIGLFGTSGEGLVSEKKLQNRIFCQITTFGKAPGVYGAVVLGSNFLKQIIINFSLPYIYTTALPFSNLALIQSSYKLLPQAHLERKLIKKNIHFFKELFTSPSDTHIQPITIPGSLRIKALARKLFVESNIKLLPLTSPSVRRNHEILRVCLHSYNTIQEIQTLHDKLCYWKNNL